VSGEGHETVIVDCAYCNGTGREGVGACPACGGDGRHKFRLQPGGRMVECRPCKGGGALGVDICSQCGGAGQHPM
jgi:DnaJ-class molecular chaperone